MVFIWPLICTRPPPISSRMTGAVTTSPLPFSNRMIAMRLPTFSRVACLNRRAPTPSRLICTAASLVRVSKTGLSIVDTLAGEYHLLLHQQKPAFTVFEHVIAKRWGRAWGGLMGLIHHAHFQRRGTSQNILGARRVLHAGKLHNHTIRTLLLDQRLGYAQLVHAVAQGDQVLRHGGLLDAMFGFRIERRLQQKFAAFVFVIQCVVEKALFDLRFALAARVGIAEHDRQHFTSRVTPE